MKPILKLLRWGLIAGFTGFTLFALAAAAAYLYIAPGLPPIDTLKEVRFQVPLRIYAANGELIAQYGEMKRTPLHFDEIPETMRHAILAAEDDRFFSHPGVDYQGLMRAALHLLRTGEKGQGGSTITMQVARNFFLTREKTYLRKVSEIFLAFHIERELSKEEILELYLNKIYLGQRAYGVAAAAQVYYGKSLDSLDAPQFAMIAGLPKAPSRYNPVADPERALVRRNYVLGRMHGLGYLDDEAYAEARAAPVTARVHGTEATVEAPHVAEMVRAEMVARYGEEAYTGGYRVHTTINADKQAAANRALRTALLDYDRRHGYRGPEANHPLPEASDEAQWRALLSGYGPIGGLPPALVVELDDRGAVVYTKALGLLYLEWDALAWARPYISENRQGAAPERADEIIQPGDIIRLRQVECGWELAQIPAVSGALVSLNPHDGAILALVGGFDFFHSKFNRATQAERQPGSNLKPFVYSAALESGYTLASLINDAPVVFEDAALENTWRPENYSGRFFGPTRLREALVRSRNLVSIRLLRAVGVDYTIDYLQRFGFDRERLPRNLSLALGSASLTPLQMARGYAVFANGGFRIEPHFIQRVVDLEQKTVLEAIPPVACAECLEEDSAPEVVTEAVSPPVLVERTEAVQKQEALAPPEALRLMEEGLVPLPESEPVAHFPPLAPQVLDPRNVYLMTSMMQDVIRHGTGRRALALGRNDLAGKTGTTNEQRDAWFSGFNGAVATTAWVGFDSPHPLGHRETGARAALPMWVDYMGTALRGVQEQPLPQPPGLVTVRIDPQTGEFASAENPNAIFELFRKEYVPERSTSGSEQSGGDRDDGGELSRQLF